MSKRILLAVVVGLMTTAALATVAFAGETLPDGDYTLALPGVGDFNFVVGTVDEDTTVTAGVAPDAYEIDDDDEAKVEWKATAEDDDSEVEAKDGKVEADVDWSSGEPVVFSIMDGLSITVIRNAADDYSIDVSDGWTVLGDNGEWLVVGDDPDLGFKVEVDEDGVEIMAVNPAEESFDDDDDADDESDDDESDDADDDADDDES